MGEIILNVEAVYLHRRALNTVILTSVITGEYKSVFGIVGNRCGTERLEFPASGHGMNVHGIGKGVFTCDDLLTNLLALPFEPIGDVGKFGLSFVCGESSVLVQSPAFSTFGAEYFGSLGCHLGFGHTVRALIKYLVKSLCAEGLGDENAVFLLIFVIVVLEGFSDAGIDLRYRHALDLLGSERKSQCGVKRYLALFSEVPEGCVQVVSSMYCHYYRNLISFNEKTEGVGEVRGGSAGRVSCLGIHTEDISSGKRLLYGFDQMEVIGEFSGADRADKLKQPGALVVTVDVYYVVDSFWCGSHGNELEIDKGHMVAEKHIRRLQTFHADLFNLVFFACKQDLGKHPNEPNEEHGLTDGVFCSFIFLGIFVIYIHFLLLLLRLFTVL